MNDGNYVVIQGWMINRLGLKGNDLFVYAIIHGFSQDGETWFTGSQKYIAESINVSRATVNKILKSLEENGHIEKKVEVVTNVSFNRYRSIDESFTGSKETLHPPVKKLDTPCKETLHNNNIYINKKDIYIAVYDSWNQKAEENPKALTKHKTLSNAMKKAIDRAKKNLGKDYDLEQLIDRFCICHKKSGQMKKRTLQEFFGQRAYQKDWLICEEFTDEGGTWLYWNGKKVNESAIPGVDVHAFEVPEGFDDY